MTQTSKTKCKFRISLSLDQIDWILANCQQDMPDLYRQLMLLKTKADIGYTKPAYDIKPSVARELSLDAKYKLACKALEEFGEVPENLAEAYQEFRYLNDLMSDTEAEAYAADCGF